MVLLLTLLLQLGGIDLVRTPGALNPDVTQSNVHKTICVTGWTSTVRPPPALTSALKRKQMKQMGFTVHNPLPLLHGKVDVSKCIPWSDNPSCYEEDHNISLELGGDPGFILRAGKWFPTSTKNLSPQPYVGEWGAKTKDRLENFLHKEVCSGRMTLADAQWAISRDWVSAFKKAGLQ